MIGIKGAVTQNRKFHQLDACALEIKNGEVVVFCGPTGSGQSTLMKAGVDQDALQVDGTMVSMKTDATVKSMKFRSRFGMVFQNFESFPQFTVVENLTLSQVRALGRSKDEAYRTAHVLLDRVGLLAYADKFPRELSGGQRRRVAIASALAAEPIAMVFDESSSVFDLSTDDKALEVITELAENGVTMICVHPRMEVC
jgi:glutamate/aspartate transport system ATP-binding protein